MFAWRRELRHEARLWIWREPRAKDCARCPSWQLARSHQQRAAGGRGPVEQGLRAANGDICTVYRFDPRREVLELLSQRASLSSSSRRFRILSEERARRRLMR